jgi:hypothetical protein
LSSTSSELSEDEKLHLKKMIAVCVVSEIKLRKNAYEEDKWLYDLAYLLTGDECEAVKAIIDNSNEVFLGCEAVRLDYQDLFNKFVQPLIYVS